MKYEEAVSRCWAEIDVDALLENYRTARGMLAPECELICVLKANAYGVGARQVAKLLRAEGAKTFAVACVSEAEEVLDEVPDADVLVLGLAGAPEAERAIRRGILLTAFSENSAATIAAAAERAGKMARVHGKIETGLHRLGFDPADVNALTALAKHPLVRLEGVFTHLALRSHESDERQFAALDRACAELDAAGVRGYRKHACDSIGMVRYPERHMGAVRTGAWLYGVCPYRYEHPERCRPVVTLKARVAQLRTLPAGECVGYDDSHPLSHDARVATLSAGYVDGFPRFNGKGEVCIHGRRAPVLGLVCMDQMMVDVTGVPDAQEGDEAILLGGPITVDEYAATAAMNRNEALSRIGKRVPRVYLQSNVEPVIRMP